MISISGIDWEELKLDNRIIEKVKIENNFSEILSKFIISNNFDQTEVYSINNKVEFTNPFLENNDFKKSQIILEKALKSRGKISIIGDYDVDGCVATSLFIQFLKKFNKPYTYYIPNRFKDGYGASLSVVKKIIKEKPELVIMLDCGSNSIEAVNHLNKKNIKTLIIDHHEIYKPYPKSSSLINPKKICNYNHLNYLCSSALTYFLIDSYIKKKSIKFNFKKNLIYVLLATICDVMPLRKLNRYLCSYILASNSLKDNVIFKKIFFLKKINRPITLNDFGFLFGPILNSAGRIDDANIVVELLINQNDERLHKILSKLIYFNEKRKTIENNIIKDLKFDELSANHKEIIFEYKTILSEGLIGIIASRAKEYYNKPSVILTRSKNMFKASARSTADFNIGKYIKNAVDKNILVSGGGHNLAAGFSIKKDKILKFKNFINSIYSKKINLNVKKYISKISIDAINYEFFNELNKLGPFGPNINKPLFLIENVKIIKPKILKEKYVSFFIKSRSTKLVKAISFSHMGSKLNSYLLNNKKQINLIVEINENFWNNKKNLQITVIDAIEISNKA